MFASVLFLSVSLLSSALLGRLVLRHLYVVPDAAFHVVNQFGVRTVVRRPGLHLHLGRFEDRSVISSAPFLVRSVVNAIGAGGAPLRVAAQFELVVTDPLRYRDCEVSFRVRGRTLSEPIVVAGVAGHGAEDLARRWDQLELQVARDVERVLAPFGVGVRSVAMAVCEPIAV